MESRRLPAQCHRNRSRHCRVRRSAMTRSLLLVGITAAGFVLVAAKAAPVSYNLPDETASLKPGPNLEVARNNCTGCHSSDYISTQPQGPKFNKDFWQAEVTKMIKVYGAPIDEADVGKIVDYLAATY